MINKGYDIDADAFHHRLLNNSDDYGYNLKFRKEVDLLKDNIKRKNMTNQIKRKPKR